MKEKQQPKVTVLMPSLNVKQYIRQCMDSVVSQTLHDIEIICVDAGSTDGTLEILREYEKNDSRIRIIMSDKKSYGYQMNLGIDASSGEYIGIVETDDWIERDMYERLYDIAKKHDVQVVKGDCKFFYGEGKNISFQYRNILPDGLPLYEKVINSNNEDKSKLFYAYNINPIGVYSLNFLNENKIRLNESPGASYQDNGLWFQIFLYANSFYFVHHAFYMIRRDNPNSSVKSTAKVYAACGEYDFIRRKIVGHPEEKKYAQLCSYFRYCNYQFTLIRIAPEYKLEFVLRFSEDFTKIRNDGELLQSLFSDLDWMLLQHILENPYDYYYTNFSAVGIKYHEVMAELSAIKNSRSYKLGQAVTWFPRKVRGGLRCLREHGFAYTFKRFLEKVKQNG